MRRREAGMTLIEVLVVVAILATIAGMVVVLVGPSQDRANRLQCVRNLSGIVGLLESGSTSRYPDEGGPNLVLYLVHRGHLAGRDNLGTLFCPGDQLESLKLAGGEEAYADLDLKSAGNGHLTSYAGRAMDDRECRVGKGGPRLYVLVADDSEDHHRGGIVVGLTGGAAKFREKVEDYGLGVDDPIGIGAGSKVEELRCLRGE